MPSPFNWFGNIQVFSEDSITYTTITSASDAAEPTRSALQTAYEYLRQLDTPNRLAYGAPSNEGLQQAPKREAKAHGGFSKWIQKIESG